MRERRRVIALAMCIAIALSMAVSSACIAHEAIHPHDCTGEDCPICQFIAQVAQARRNLGALLLLALIVCLAPVSRRERRVPESAVLSPLSTLVAQKIRLNS